MNNKRPAFVSLCLLLLLTSVLLAACSKPYEFVGTVIEPPRPAPAVEGVNWDGTPFTFQEMQGKVTLIFFGYTTCPDICPTTLADFKRLKGLLDESEQQEVAFLMVSVDPERDTVERMAQFIPAFDSSFYGVRFEEELLAEVKQHYNIFAEKAEGDTSQAGYLIDHTASTLVLNRDADYQLVFSYGTDINTILPDIRQLLKE